MRFHPTLFLGLCLILQVNMRWKTYWTFMCDSMVAVLPLNPRSNGANMALSNPHGSLGQIPLTPLRLSLLFRNAEGSVRPLEGVDLRFYFSYPYYFGYVWLFMYLFHVLC